MFCKEKVSSEKHFVLLKINFEPTEYSVDIKVFSFKTKSSKDFDKVPHYELLKKVSKIGVGGCIWKCFSTT